MPQTVRHWVTKMRWFYKFIIAAVIALAWMLFAGVVAWGGYSNDSLTKYVVMGVSAPYWLTAKIYLGKFYLLATYLTAIAIVMTMMEIIFFLRPKPSSKK
jgi:hypothetical protein